jgi:hypothetical protein
MFPIGDISRFEGEKGTCKILKPVWDVITDYLVLFLAMLSIAFAGMEVTSGSFQCLAAVDCPGISRSNTSGSLLSHIKYGNACKAFYSSQKTNIIKRTDVVTDLKNSFQYINFVNSECSKSAIPNFLAYFWFVLFIEAFVLIVLDNLWLKLPTTASIIENFVVLVMECYASPCPNWALTQALSDMPATHNADDQQREGNNFEMANPTFDDDRNESYEFNILEDPATISSVKALCEKVHTLEENVKSSDKFVKIWQLYLLQSILQVSFAITFFIVDIYYMKDLEETMTCTLTQHIPVAHDYFICSHSLAPAFALGLKLLYLPTLGLALAIFIFITVWTFSRKGKNKFKYDFEEERLPRLVGIKLSDIPPVKEDFGFLLHLLHSYNKLYVIRFAHFLSKKNIKKIQAYWLKREYPVSNLERQLKENGNKLTFTGIQGIPETIFNLATEIVTLEFIECRLENDDFQNFCQLISLRKLSIIKCGLKSIPEGILNVECLEVLNLKGNFIAKVNRNISNLQNLTTLDLSDNNLETIEPESFENLDNLLAVYLSGNSKLQMSALKVVLACGRLRILDSPRHLSKYELNQMEQDKFDAVKFSGKGNFVIPYTPEDAPHIDLEAHEKIYKMNSRPKGIAIIINNYSYQNTRHPDRRGSEKDVSVLKSLFDKIGFETICRIDNEAKQAKEFLEKCAKNTKYKECDCIAVIIMSHGSEEGLIFPDSKVLPVMDLVKSVQESPFYQEKPKLFFIQACRGTQHAGGFANLAPRSYVTVGNSHDNVASASNQNTVHSIPHDAVTDAFLLSAGGNKDKKTTTDALPHVMIQPPSIPEGADILLSYSTMDGYVSVRNTGSGSWYVQALVETFCEHAWEEDILSLLTLVNYKVARAYSQAGWRQVPAPQSTLTKKLYLLPGYPPQQNTYV